VFSVDGQQIKEVPLQVNGSPVGVAVAPDGRLLVANAKANVVESLPSP
jgi:glucose/arabinose dehydrogenase